MNRLKRVGSIRALTFRASRYIACLLPGGRIRAFGKVPNSISAILVINLDRQPQRWRRVLRELARFRTVDGLRLTTIVRRLVAVDARDGKAVAATADVDVAYRMRDQLFVQPQQELADCFEPDEIIRMTRQEIAVARSHVEAWKAIAAGNEDYVLVVEDDIWLRPGAAKLIDRGWQEALDRCLDQSGPRLLYFSYMDAGNTAERKDPSDALFRPIRGLWFLSAYVLSRDGAMDLLRAMPIVGPVDLWMNFRLDELGAFALSSPAIFQREDGGSDNSYSILPYLARCGVVNAGSGRTRSEKESMGIVLASTNDNEHEHLSMALSMLGLRVRAYDGNEKPIDARTLATLAETYEALVNAPLTPDAAAAVSARSDAYFLLTEEECLHGGPLQQGVLPKARVAVVQGGSERNSWRAICSLLSLPLPDEPFPTGTPRSWRLFRDDREEIGGRLPSFTTASVPFDDSPWVLPSHSGWQPKNINKQESLPPSGELLVSASMTASSACFVPLNETFPGNRAMFSRDALIYEGDGTHLIASKTPNTLRRYRSGAFASAHSFSHVRCEAEIRAAKGAGLITGFFLHRDRPRQEIDIELLGDKPGYMLANVYFNPGDDGAAFGFGYRGTPFYIDLGFDTTTEFHLYTIDWHPDRIRWIVDGKLVHERVSWDPTPIPYLPMRLYANLWIPESRALAGRLNEEVLPATAIFRNIAVYNGIR